MYRSGIETSPVGTPAPEVKVSSASVYDFMPVSTVCAMPSPSAAATSSSNTRGEIAGPRKSAGPVPRR